MTLCTERRFAEGIPGRKYTLMEHLPDFQQYLEAKRLLDIRSLNRRVLRAFKSRLERMPDASVIDLGTGTGLMIRSLIGFRLRGDVYLCGVDRDEISLKAALGFLEGDLRSAGYRGVSVGRDSCRAVNEEATVRIDMKTGDVLEPNPAWIPHGISFSAVTANAFMDLLPLDAAVRRIRDLLLPHGLFYSTINYDGTTTLLPPYGDRGLEKRLFEIFNESMEQRRVLGAATGGARTGSRLFSTLAEGGFKIIAWGSSDWTVLPRDGRYPQGEDRFLRSILAMIHGEGAGSGLLPGEGLDLWLLTRLRELEEGILSFMNHQTDILARRETGEAHHEEN
jgi:SAM-dependent methyltransferase